MYFNFFLLFLMMFNIIGAKEQKSGLDKSFKKKYYVLEQNLEQNAKKTLKLKQLWKKAYREYKRNIRICKANVMRLARKSNLNFDYLYMEYCVLQIPKVQDPDVLGWESGIHSMSFLPMGEKGATISLSIGDLKINQLKPSSLLYKEELKAYKDMLYTEADSKQFFQMKHQVNKNEKIENGMYLLRYIHYPHLIFLMQSFFNKSSSFQSKKTKLDYSLIKGPKDLNFMKIFDKLIINPDEKNRKKVKDIFFTHKKIKTLMVDNTQENRKVLMNSFIGGLVNLDPRVRLFSIYMLRRLIPSIQIWDIVNSRIDAVLDFQKKEFQGVQLDNIEETVQYAIYEFKNLDWKSAYKIVYDELVLLRRFISRFILVNSIKKVYDIDMIANMNESLFSLLARPIDGEAYCKVPIYYFDTKEEIESLYIGLQNENPAIQKELLKALTRFLLTRDIDFRLRLDVFKKLIQSDFHGYFLEDWNLEQKNSILESEKEFEILFKIYLKKNPTIPACLAWDPDQYDQKGIGFDESAKQQRLLAKVKSISRKYYFHHLTSFLDPLETKTSLNVDVNEETKEAKKLEREKQEFLNKIVKHLLYEKQNP